MIICMYDWRAVRLCGRCDAWSKTSLWLQRIPRPFQMIKNIINVYHKIYNVWGEGKITNKNEKGERKRGL